MLAKEKRYILGLDPRTGGIVTRRQKLVDACVILLATLIAVAVVVLVGIQEGAPFAWRLNTNLEFKWHPMLASIGFIFLFGTSLMVYRTDYFNKKCLMIVHALLHTAALACMIVSLVAVFDFHNFHHPPITNFQSLHSWIGILAVAVFTIQWAVGILTMHPGVPSNIQNKMLPLHVYFGIMAFLCSVTAAVLGYGKSNTTTTKGIEGNVTGLLILVYSMLVFFVLLRPR